MKKNNIILAIDVGNTRVSLAVLKGLKVLQEYDVETAASKQAFSLKFKQIARRIRNKYPHLQAVIFCSVVPALAKVVRKCVQNEFGIKPIAVGQDIKVPMKNKYRHPKQVGQDRLVCAYATICHYQKPAIIIDFGTAITFDVVSTKGEYEGGLIVPGIRLSTESLFHKTALLPKIHTIQSPRSLIGKTTHDSILSGIFFGYGVMCRGLIELISKNIKGKPQIIVTGGYSHLMKKFIARKITKVDNFLVFKGLSYLYKNKITQ